MNSPDALERFWSKVSRCDHGDACDECCWPWTASRDRDAYGKFKTDGRIKKAHRMAYELVYGPIPVGLSVCHACDNPSCTNPHHLWIGTPGDNMRDKAEKGRTGRAKLTTTEITEIKLFLDAGELNQRQIAAWYGISHQHVNHINTGRKHAQILSPAEWEKGVDAIGGMV